MRASPTKNESITGRKSNLFFAKNGRDAFFSDHSIQPKLTVNQPNDKYEQEADAMADKVVQRQAIPFFNRPNHPHSFFNTSSSSIQRKCTACEQEEKLQKKDSDEEEMETLQRKPIFESNQEEPIQRKGDAVAQSVSSPSLESSLSNSKGNGSSIPTSTNDSMSNTFGNDFSHVKIHTDSSAVQMNKELNAQAFTHGSDIYFNEGKYNTNNTEGNRLLAHELTHVVQQNKLDDNIISRAVSDRSVCDRTVDTAAPPSPLIFVILSNTIAEMHLSTAKLTMTLDMMNTSGNLAGPAFDAYRRRFADPVAVGNKFRNRFNSTLLNSLAEAQASEMTSLIGILDRIGNVLARDIDYRCIGPHARTIGGTLFDCATTGFSLISTQGVNRIIICPSFWGLNPGQRGVGLIHEAVHILFPFGDHDTAPFAQSSNQRRTEPECYASLVADLNNVQPLDPSCPPV
ncbi:MAG: DUF4157 domain-containing protein [Chitinophagaceae bacterium]